MKVAVGSTNPIKIEAVRQAFTTVWPDESWEIEGINVESGVSQQPMSDEESIDGARNRAQRAQKALQAEWGVGLEGGMQKINEYWFTCGWMVVIDQDGKEGIGSTVNMVVPPKVMELIDQGIELGVANDMVFQQMNSKHAEGHFGLMTNNRITRMSGYQEGLIAALVRFIRPEVF